MTPHHPPVIDTTVADRARRYDYWLGGNFAVDRGSGDLIAEWFRTIPIAARESRRFMRDAMTPLAKAGGLPAPPGRAPGTPAGLVVSGGVPLSQPPVLRRHTPTTIGPKGRAS